MKSTNVFISWSGERSRLIAEALYDWVPKVVQSVKPFLSSQSIEAGSRGQSDMAKALEVIKVGVSCLTPENLSAPWIHFEAGALTKALGDDTRLCTYLLGGLTSKDVQPPLNTFQHSSPDKKGTRKLLGTLNRAVGEDDALEERTLDDIFNQFWPVFEKQLKNFPSVATSPPKRTTDSMLEEILELLRSDARRTPSNLQNYRGIATTTGAYFYPAGPPSFYMDDSIGAGKSATRVYRMEDLAAFKDVNAAPEFAGAKKPGAEPVKKSRRSRT